jgi:phage terminase large subunit-like protein
MEYPELKRAVCEQAHAFAADVVLIEDKASGTQLIQALIEQCLHAVTRSGRRPTRSWACMPGPR